MKKVLSFPPAPPILFQNFLCSLFLFAIPQKKKKRDISFENEEGLKGNARNCLHSEKVECLHGNIGGCITHGMQGSCAIGGSRAKRQPTTCQRVLPALATPQRSEGGRLESEATADSHRSRRSAPAGATRACHAAAKRRQEARERSDSRQSPEPTFGASGCCPPGKEILNTNKIRCYSVSC